jgi:hypothetical protein
MKDYQVVLLESLSESKLLLSLIISPELKCDWKCDRLNSFGYTLYFNSLPDIDS